MSEYHIDTFHPSQLTHQSRDEWWFDFAILQCNPIDGSEEGVAFDLSFSDAWLTAQPSSRILSEVLWVVGGRPQGGTGEV